MTMPGAPARQAPAPTPIDPDMRHVEARLRFAPGGGRTVLAAQRTPYPFHITRAFHLDAPRADLATLYLQSASGGIYRGDRLALTIEVAAGAAVHVTTQGATIVHDTRDSAAELVSRIDVGHDAVALFTPDPLVLFPGADVASRTEIVLGAGATAIATDGFAHHDPSAAGRAFRRYAVATVVRDERGVLVADQGSLAGTAFAGEASPLGPYRAAGTLFVLGRGSDRLDPAVLEARLTATGCLAGISQAPNNAGVAGRILAPDGGTLRRGLDAAFAVAFQAVLGIAPAPRRK
jgi:urease accessory protein